MIHQHLVELLTPNLDIEDLDAALERYAERHRSIMEAGFVISVPDNPMGIPRFQPVEVINELGLEFDPEQFLLHINTFHTKEDVDRILGTAAELGVRYVLVVTGDGGGRLAKLTPRAIGEETMSVTSVELLRYVHKAFPGKFITGAAFNPYEPMHHEIAKLRDKRTAGASFVISQPVIGQDDRLDPVLQMDLPLVIGAWMSKRIDLFSECVGYEVVTHGTYSPMANLMEIQSHYPDQRIYLALVGFKTQLPELTTMLNPQVSAA